MKTKKNLLFIIPAIIIGFLIIKHWAIFPTTAYLKSFQVKKQLEEVYYDDEFTLVDSDIIWTINLFSSPFFEVDGYTYDFKSKQCDKIINVKTGFGFGNQIRSNYLDIRFKNSAKELIEKSLNNYFGEGHYCYTGCDTTTYSFCNIEATTPNIYDYIKESLIIRIIVDDCFNTKNEKRIQNDIINNLNSTFNIQTNLQTNIQTEYFFISILFDKKDNINIPPTKEITISQFLVLEGQLNYWDKNLEIQRKPNHSSWIYEWRTNDKKSSIYKTKNNFLNGSKPMITINDYTFSLDESITLKEFLDKTGYVHRKTMSENNKFNPDNIFETKIYINKEELIIDIVNKTDKETNLENGSICAIKIGDIYRIKSDSYQGCSVCGLKIGDTSSEEDLINKFGPYETKEINDQGTMFFKFVDGSSFPPISEYERELIVSLSDGKIGYLCCFYPEPNNCYDFTY